MTLLELQKMLGEEIQAVKDGTADIDRAKAIILESENGASLKASGYKCIGKCGGLRWTGKRKPEVDLYPAQMKLRFERSEK